MRTFKAVFERDFTTGSYVGYIPGFQGAHSHAETPEKLRENLVEVVKMLLEDGEPELDGELVGTETIQIA
jgi:predicted RNase H-like HicB family nuclease